VATRIPARLTAGEGRRFGVTVGLVFLAIAGVSLWRGREIAPAATGALGVALVVTGLLVPTRLGPVYRTWMGLGNVLSRVTTPVMLGLMYFGVLTPIGLLRRFFGANSLRRTRPGSTGWVSRRTETVRTDMKRQF